MESRDESGYLLGGRSSQLSLYSAVKQGRSAGPESGPDGSSGPPREAHEELDCVSQSSGDEYQGHGKHNGVANDNLIRVHVGDGTTMENVVEGAGRRGGLRQGKSRRQARLRDMLGAAGTAEPNTYNVWKSTRRWESARGFKKGVKGSRAFWKRRSPFRV